MASLPKEMDVETQARVARLRQVSKAWVSYTPTPAVYAILLDARSREIAALAATWGRVNAAAFNATAAIGALQLRLKEIARWHRFDTITGPAIGATVILGSLALAALAAWMGGAP